MSFQDDLFSCAVDQLDDSPKGVTVVSSIGRQQFDSIKLGARGLISALPTQLKVLSQKRNCVSIIDPQHHVVPCGVVLAEIDSADVRCAVVDDDQLLMIAAE